MDFDVAIQRSMTTVSPAASATCRASSETIPNWSQSTFAPIAMACRAISGLPGRGGTPPPRLRACQSQQVSGTHVFFDQH